MLGILVSPLNLVPKVLSFYEISLSALSPKRQQLYKRQRCVTVSIVAVPQYSSFMVPGRLWGHGCVMLLVYMWGLLCCLDQRFFLALLVAGPCNTFDQTRTWANTLPRKQATNERFLPLNPASNYDGAWNVATCIWWASLQCLSNLPIVECSLHIKSVICFAGFYETCTLNHLSPSTLCWFVIQHSIRTGLSQIIYLFK